jgi:hypothetical protein
MADVQEKVPTLAEVIEQILGILQDHEDKLSKVCAAHEELDKEIHEDFFGPIHEQYKAGVRSRGIEGMRERHGAKFADIGEDQWKAFGIDDLFARLYDTLEALKGGEGFKAEEFDEGKWIDGIHEEAMSKIKAIRGPEAKEAESPAAEVAVEVKKEPDKPAKAKFAAGKKSMIDGY